MGVFLGPPSPAELDRRSWSIPTASALGLTFSPLLAQVFFIGDGPWDRLRAADVQRSGWRHRLFFGLPTGCLKFGSPADASQPGRLRR